MIADPGASFDAAGAADVAQRVWDAEALPALSEYIRIPNVSPDFAPDWAAEGHMDRAVALVRDWCAARPVAGARVEVHRLPGRTPLLTVEVPPFGTGRDDDPVLLYGHLDKQPEMTGWREGLGPWEPVLEGDRLYGRGAADDGYAAFAAMAAVQAVQEAGGSHNRCIVLIEAGEESGSPDLPAYFDALADRIGAPGLVVALDSDSTTYDRMWITTSLRGIVIATLEVSILTEGVHSGLAGGIVPSSFRILRHLLDRVEDSETGQVLLPELQVDIPGDRIEQLRELAATVGDEVRAFPFVPGARPQVSSAYEALVSSMWKPAVAVVGADGLPPLGRAGNVLRPSTAVRLAVRVPPTCDAAAAARALERSLTTDVPYGAGVRLRVDAAEDGWNAPEEPAWLAAALERASLAAYGEPPARIGVGGSIPFIAMLGRRFPEAGFVVTGVLGPGSNAHGPNEFLHLPTARRLTAAVAQIIDAQSRRPGL